MKITQLILSLILVARDGLYETEMLDLLKKSTLLKDISVEKQWIKFSWFLSPLLMQSNKIQLMDKQLRIAGIIRYQDHIKSSHEILYQYFNENEDVFIDKYGKNKW